MIGLVVLVFLVFALMLLMTASGWMVFAKAGQPGWASLVPVYNAYVFTTGVIEKPPVWMLLLFVPFVNLIPVFLMAKKFGKEAGFAVGLILVPFVFLPMLAFGDAVHDSQLRGRRGGRDYSDYEEDEDDEDDRPRGKRRSLDDEDDADDDVRPAKRRPAVAETDADDRPARQRRPADDDADDRPARRRRRDDD